MSPEPLEEPLEEPSAHSARNPGSEEAGASRSAQPDATNTRDGEGSKPSPTNAHWKAKCRELEEAFGPEWGPWLKDLVPITDDGELLVLGAPSKFWRDYVANSFTDLLESVLQQCVQIAVFDKSVVAAVRRNRKRSEKSAETSGQPP